MSCRKKITLKIRIYFEANSNKMSHVQLLEIEIFSLEKRKIKNAQSKSHTQKGRKRIAKWVQRKQNKQTKILKDRNW